MKVPIGTRFSKRKASKPSGDIVVTGAAELSQLGTAVVSTRARQYDQGRAHPAAAGRRASPALLLLLLLLRRRRLPRARASGHGPLKLSISGDSSACPATAHRFRVWVQSARPPAPVWPQKPHPWQHVRAHVRISRGPHSPQLLTRRDARQIGHTPLDRRERRVCAPAAHPRTNAIPLEGQARHGAN